MGVSGQHHAPAALYPRGKNPRYPLYRRLGLCNRIYNFGEINKLWFLELFEDSFSFPDMGVKLGSLTLREEHRLREFENRVLGKYLDLRGMRLRGNGGSCTMRNFIICTHPQILLSK
jgi:hypothetical protein